MTISEKRLIAELRERLDLPDYDTSTDAEILKYTTRSFRDRAKGSLALDDLRLAIKQELIRLKNWLFRRN